MTDLKNNLEEVWIQKGSFGYVVVKDKDSNPEWINRPFQVCSIFVLNKTIQEYQKEIELLKLEKDEFKKYSTMWFDKKNELAQELQKTREQLSKAEQRIFHAPHCVTNYERNDCDCGYEQYFKDKQGEG